MTFVPDLTNPHVAPLAEIAKRQAERIAELEAALRRIAGHPENYRDQTTSYAVGWAFWNVQNIAKAALAPKPR